MKYSTERNLAGGVSLFGALHTQTSCSAGRPERHLR
jgi:hypothetical protein